VRPPSRTFSLRLTLFELLHLRDLFSILLPPEVKQTVSQALAAAEDREIVEAKLWQKVSNMCRAAALPLDDAAPDFVCAASAAPPVSVFRLAHEPAEEAENKHDEGSVFDAVGEKDPHFHPGDDDDGGAPTPSKVKAKDK
jgi:hypothetical protein